MRAVSVLAGLFTTLLLACADAPTAPPSLKAAQFAAVTQTINEVVPFASTVFVPCAARGAGEDVLLSGRLHVLLHLTITSNGVIAKGHFQPMGVSGTGVSTGDSYQGTGVTQDINASHEGVSLTLNNNFRIIGPGPGNNVLVHHVFHLTIGPSGEIVNLTTHFSSECR